MDGTRAAEGLSRIQAEIQAEKAAALARIAATLEDLVAELERTRRAAAQEPRPEARRPCLERYRLVRERALRYRWYLEVQREAIGLTRHEALDELYPIPQPLS